MIPGAPVPLYVEVCDVLEDLLDGMPCHIPSRGIRDRGGDGSVDVV
jgi:hypothetical protein